MQKVIVSDLDHTLIKTDLLFEALLKLIKKYPLTLFLLPFWLLGGKVLLKKNIFNKVEIDPETLPYNQKLFDFLKNEKENGAKLILATASPQRFADKIAAHLKIFDEVFGTTDKLNLKGSNKAKLLVEKYGEKGFIYAGDSKADYKIWDLASGAITVDRNVSSKYNVIKEFKTKDKAYIISLIKQIRVYQWVKNILLFLPLLMAHNTILEPYLDIFIAFLSFSLIASSVYVLNDLLDLDSDRVHPRKKNRPFAAGALPIRDGLAYFPILLLFGFALAYYLLPSDFFVTVLIYYIITTLYSFKLKKIALVDVLTLGALYTIRIIAGGRAADVEISPWLLAFSMFIFMSLAFVKRYTEMLLMVTENKKKSSGRGYEIGDSNLLLSFGSASGLMAVLVFALYTNSEIVKSLYSHYEFLMLIDVLLIYWIARMWLLSHRGKMTDDPIVFTVKDSVSWVLGMIVIAIVLLAKF